MEHTTSDVDIFRKTTEVLDKLEQNQQLQQMAYENGIDTKNSCRLTAATKENIAVCVVSMLLAKQNNDPLCNDLVRFGMQHRNTKAQIVNKYKNEANALIKRYRNGEKPEEKIEVITIKSEAFLDNDIPDIYNEYYFTSWSDKVVQEGVGRAVALGVAGVIALPFVLIYKAIELIVTLIDKFIGLFTRISPERLLKKLEKIPNEKRETFTMSFNEGEIEALTLSSDAFCKALDLMDVFCDHVTDAISSDQVDGRINKWAQDLRDDLDKLSRYRELNVDITSTKRKISYDDVVSLLHDLSQLNMTDVKNRTKRLKKVMSKIETVSMKQQAETHEGVTIIDIVAFKVAINVAVILIQKWINGRDKILRTASRTIDTEDYELLAEKRRAELEKKELEENQDSVKKEAEDEIKYKQELREHESQMAELFSLGTESDLIHRAKDIADRCNRYHEGSIDSDFAQADRRAMLRATGDIARRYPETAKKIADILNGQPIDESYREFIRSSVGQYYLEEDGDTSLSAGEIVAGTALGVGLVAIWLVALPFKIIIGVLRAIVRFIKSIINSFRTFDVDKMLQRMERIPQEKRKWFFMEFDVGATDFRYVMSSDAIAELINQFDELSKNTSDVKSIDMTKWRELQDSVTAINQGRRMKNIGDRIRGAIGVNKGSLSYDEAKYLLVALKYIDVKALASRVKDFNQLIEQKTREMKKAEAEARAAGGATDSNTDQMKSDANEIQRIGNNVLLAVQKWTSTTMAIMKSANAAIYRFLNNGKVTQDTTVMKNGRVK